MKAIIKAVAIAALVLIVVFVAAGCKGDSPASGGSTAKKAASPTSGQNPNDDTSASKDNGAVSKEKAAQAIRGKVPIKLYFGDSQAEYLVPETRYIPDTSATAKIAVEELIKGPAESGHTKTIPAEAKVLNVDVIRNVAYVNFSQELVSKHWGGSTGEQMTVGSIVNTLTEFENIQKVQIMVDGKAVETIAGHLDTSLPLARDESLIKK